MASIQALLRGTELFKGFGARAIRRIALQTVFQDSRRGAHVLRRGQLSVGLYIVLRGHVKLSLVAANRREKVVAVVGPGQTFAEEALFFGDTAILDAQCVEHSKLLLVARGSVFAECNMNPLFLRNLLHHLIGRLRDLLLDVEACSFFSGTARVIAYLLRTLPAASEQEPRRLVLETKKKVIALQVNVTPEHLSRIFHELVAAHVIEMHGREIVIPDLEKLRSHMQLHELHAR